MYIRKVLALLLSLVFLGSTGVLVHQHFQKQDSTQAVQEAQELAAVSPAEVPLQTAPVVQSENLLAERLNNALHITPETLRDISETVSAAPALIAQSRDITSWLPVIEDSNADKLLSMDIRALQSVNSDVLGWFMIPGTNISYPLLQGSDNDYYLNYTWDNRESFVGSIFMEHTSDPNLSDFNTIIYGHNLGDAHMFSTLTKYRSQSHWSEHPYLYIVNENGAFRYQIFSACQVTTDSGIFRIRFRGPESKQAYLDDALSQSVIQTGITPVAGDRILTLTTCVRGQADSRFIVQARLEGQLAK